MDLDKVEAVERFAALRCWVQASCFHHRTALDAQVPSSWEYMQDGGPVACTHSWGLNAGCHINTLNFSEGAGNVCSSLACNPGSVW